MIDVESTETGIRAVDAAKSSIDVEMDLWTETDQSLSITERIDAAVSGVVSTLRFPPVLVVVDRLDTDEQFELGSDVGPLELPTGEYSIRIDGNLLVYLRFDGAANVAKPGYEQVVVSFDDPTQVTLGFRSRTQSPPETITVPETPGGVATALTYSAAAHRTTTPDRSFPSMRGHPPLVEFGDETAIPAVVAERRESVDVELTLPPRLDYLFTASPLAHYLGATVQTGEGATPTLRTPDRTEELPRLPRFQDRCAAILSAVFMLDCLVRNAGPYSTNLEEMRHLDTLGLDAASLYEASISTRLDAYLSVPFSTVEGEFPEWHVSLYVDPTFDHVETLPYLLDALPNVFLPSSESLSGSERMTRSLDDFYRQRETSVSVNLIKPHLKQGRMHGWLADGAPIDVFKTVPEAYPNRFNYRDRAGDPISVVAVLNDDEMSDEHAAAAALYRQRATELDIDISVREHLSTEELATVFETPHDFVHYIGHCEESGLRCNDGHLSISSLNESKTQTFFLNACGSFYEGLELVRQGSVAGAVTFNKVLDSQAARVGTSFVNLLMNGFSLERALRLSRRRIMTGKDYSIVGDGTHVLTQSHGFVPGEAQLDVTPDGWFDLSYDVFSPSAHGGHYQPYFPGNVHSYLNGRTTTARFDREELREFLEIAHAPVVYDGDIRWSERVAGDLYE